jgi:lipid II:glycine glycyltransferase (peptidoglycan interpeptide bridge formation enzyme)
MAQGLIAEVDGQAVAGLILFLFVHKAWYFYGMSSGKHHEKMPNYLLQWEAIRLAKEKGCRIYDLWGAPDKFEDEADSMLGVYRFKLGLGGLPVCTVGAWDYVLNKFAYYLYRHLLPKILGVMRKVRRSQIQMEAGG